MTTKDEELMLPVRDFRNRLILSGFGHANSAGELKSKDGTTWVGIGFAHGEVRIYMWRRPTGYGTPEGRCYFAVTDATHEDELTRLGSWLGTWAYQPPSEPELSWPFPDSHDAGVKL